MGKSLLRSLRFMREYRLAVIGSVMAVLAASAAELAAPQLLRQLIDEGVVAGDVTYIWYGSAALIILALISGAAIFLQGHLSAKVSHNAAFNMRNEVFSKVQRLSFSYHDRAETGQLITRITSDVDLIRDFIGGGLIQAISAVLILLGSAVLLISMNITLAIIALSVFPATLLILYFFVRKLGVMFRGFQQQLARLNTVLQENLAGARVVRSFANEDYEESLYRAANHELLTSGLAIRSSIANAFPLLFSVGSFGLAVVVWVGTRQIIAGTLSVGELVAFSSYLALMLQPLFVLGFGAQQIARAGAGAQRLFEILDAEIEVRERADAIHLDKLNGDVEFDNVYLRYPGDDRDVLKGISFSAAPNTTVAIVGATGSGKSTLINLIARYYDVTQGVVYVDGHDVRDLTLSSLRRNIAVVMQEPVLFSGSIRDNIAYGRPDATFEQVKSAARLAQAHEFISGLADGYATDIGERGVRLSGGQRQRIAIARALLINPRILVLDDSSASVDPITERALQDSLKTLIGSRTTIVIASRLSSVRLADKILLIDEGKIADQGTHNELLARSCLYAEIASTQLAGGSPIDAPAHCTLRPAPERES